MTEDILDNESTIRLGIFLGVLVLVATWEALSPPEFATVPPREVCPRTRSGGALFIVGIASQMMTRLLQESTT